MKTPLLTIAGLLIATTFAVAQDNARYDATYSTRNYKHANKAAEARRWEQKAGTPVNAPTLQDNAVANYKQPKPGVAPVGGVSVPTNGPASVASRNYKAQHNYTTTTDETRYTVRKPGARSAASTTGEE